MVYQSLGTRSTLLSKLQYEDEELCQKVEVSPMRPCGMVRIDDDARFVDETTKYDSAQYIIAGAVTSQSLTSYKECNPFCSVRLTSWYRIDGSMVILQYRRIRRSCQTMIHPATWGDSFLPEHDVAKSLKYYAQYSLRDK
jgi:hypothetical protein